MLAIAFVVLPIDGVLPCDLGSGHAQHKGVGPTAATYGACSGLFDLRCDDCACQVLQLQSEWQAESDPRGAADEYGGLGRGLLPLVHHCEDGHLMSLSLETLL